MGNINTQLQQLLQKEMSRREFLTTLGLGVLSIVGFSALLQALGKSDSRSVQPSLGYGSNFYGGRKQ